MMKINSLYDRKGKSPRSHQISADLSMCAAERELFFLDQLLIRMNNGIIFLRIIGNKNKPAQIMKKSYNFV